MNKSILMSFFLLFALISYSQNIAITDDDTYNADPSAMLDVKALDKGVLVPRLTTIQRNLISNPATGLLVFDTNKSSFYFYNGSAWVSLTDSTSASNLWTKSGASVHLSNNTDKVGVGTSTPVGKFEVKSNVDAGVNEPIFYVVNNTNDTVFAVYQEGVRIYVADNPAKANTSKGGFAVGGFSPSKGTFTNEYLRVTPDSVRVYVPNSNPAKANTSKGGFAVGGFSPAKNTPDSAYYMFSEREGFRVTFLTEAERDAISNPAKSSIIFNTTDSCLQVFLGYWESIWCTPMGCVYPTIDIQPVSDTSSTGIDSGGEVQFSVLTIGSKIYYKWQESKDGGSTWKMISDGGTSPMYSGSHTDTLVISNVQDFCSGYQYRCHVSNACGTELSTPATLYTGCGITFNDSRDMQVYSTVKIGNQCWMKKNLNIGTMINSSAGGQLQNPNTTIEKYCYGNLASNCDLYGGLYEWGEMMDYHPSDSNNPGTTQGICPVSWHLPTEAEWTELTDFLGGLSVAGGKLKDTGIIYWSAPNEGATNESGFSAWATGFRNNINGSFYNIALEAIFWTATSTGSPRIRKLTYSDATVTYGGIVGTQGYAVRCIKD